MPRPWGPPKDGKEYTQEEVEYWGRRDRFDSLNCATPALIYADHMKRRDARLSGKR